MTIVLRRSLFLLSFVPLLAACASSPGPGPAAATGAQTAGTAAPPGTAWKDMNHEQRLAYMKSTVFPKMKDLFSAYDNSRYGDMTCKTCHGQGAVDATFMMPNPALPKLPATMEGFQKLAAEKPKAAEFMGKQVVPTMANFLGEQPFDMQTKQGFGCMRCHTTGS
jgi:hypothetical protein